MSVKSKVLSAGVLFFLGGQMMLAQKAKKDTLQEKKIEDVVVLGYSKVTTKAKATTASTTVTAEQIENRPNVSFLNSLQGSAPGISINSGSGSPGSSKIDMLIRGFGTLASSTDPLFVIDGVATTGSQFRNIDSNDIETISVLRDAQATSIYGNRAANGVVVVTTKTARYGSPLRVSYNATTSFSVNPNHKYQLADARQLLTIQKRAGGGIGHSMTQEEIDKYSVNTNWEKEFMQVGMNQTHNVGLRFGGENASVFSSLGYTDVEGIIKSTDFKRFTFRNNIQGRSRDRKLSYSANIGVGYSKRNQLDEEARNDIDANTIQNVLLGTVLANPYLPKYNFANGVELYQTIGSNLTPYRPWVLYDNMIGGVRNRREETTIMANINGNYKLTENITIGNRTAVDYRQFDNLFARSPLGFLSTVVAASRGSEYGGSESFTTARDLTFNTITNVQYNKQFGEHSLSAGVYLDYLKAHYFSKSQGQDGLNPMTWEFGAGTGYIPFNPSTPNFYRPSASAFKAIAGTLAYFGTIDYDYSGKYGLSGTIRRDASYRFSKDNRWETFWSLGGRWNIDKENFMDGSAFRMLKLRASYGTQGNQTLDSNGTIFTGPSRHITYNQSNTGYQNGAGFSLANLANDNLRWEKQSQANIGLDVNYKGIVELNVDVYRKHTTRLFSDILLSYITGQGSVKGNNGEMENKGVEANLRLNLVRTEDTKLTVFVNGAYNKNTILAIDTENLEEDNVNVVGGPAFQWYLYPYVGVNPKNGNRLFLDINGKQTEAPTVNDRRFTGKSILPKFNGGFGFNVDHKGFFMDVLFSFQTGGWNYDWLHSWLNRPEYANAQMNVESTLLNAWTSSNTNSNIPSLSSNNISREGSSDRFLYKTDFIRLKNISFGYNLPKKSLQGLPIRGMKVFAMAENAYIWTDWKGYDPEPRLIGILGVYPNPRTYSLGVNIEL